MKRRGARGSLDDPMEGSRDEAIEVLSECFARDMITVEELERRTELVHRARTRGELGSAVDGIEVPGAAGVPTGQAGVGQVGVGQTGVGQTGVGHAGVGVAPVSSDRAIAIFGETRREGRWTPATRTQAVAVMGSTVLDFREAALPPGRTVVSAVAFMGSVEILVPPECMVECVGSAVMGSFEQRREYMPFPGGPGGPVLRVDGFAMMGSVEIERRQVGESRRDAKRRRKLEKKEMKRLRSGR